MPSNRGNESSNTPGPSVHLPLRQSSTLANGSASDNRAVVVGLYGVPGSGKTFLLNQLKRELGEKLFVFYEGSKMIADVVPGGLDAFHQMEQQEQVHWRQSAIDVIRENCVNNGKVAVVAGHFMFWSEEQKDGRPVYTTNDLVTFTHILYLDVPAEVITRRRLDDTERNRPSASATHICKWQEAEKKQLRRLCQRHSILFSLLPVHPTLLKKVSTLLLDFQHHNEKSNLAYAESRLDEALVAGQSQWETVLVIDADRTLGAEDAGALFWKKISGSCHLGDESSSPTTVFKSPLGYSYTAFRQATCLYEELAGDQEYDALCQDVASTVAIYPEFVSLLRWVAESRHVGAVVISCGLRLIWDKVLEKEGLSKTVKVIGGGRISDGIVVSPAVKGALVTRLRTVHGMHVWAFGDSPLDLDMLGRADEAIIVVGEEQCRSKTMDAALANAIDHDNLVARQTILPSSASPRLDITRLPTIKLTEPKFVESLLGGRYAQGGLRFLCATDRNAARLLATPMRDAAVAGPHLREAHRRVGWYLAIDFVADVVGLEESPIQHVLGHQTRGYQLFHEQQTTIVALMRGGESMAFGVNDAFPLAMFVHADVADDVKLHHLQGQLTVILVDSVVNTGKTIIEFVEHVRKIHATIHIVVVAGVVQAQCVSKDGLHQTLAHHARLDLISLRLSDTKFTGSGTTDTGNRLLNTTHLA